MYILSSSFRRIALLLNVGKSTVHYWVDRFKDILEYGSKEKVEKMRKLAKRIAVDETILKYNGRKCYLFAALDIERNKIIHLKVYSARNALTAYSFLKEVLRMCEVEEIVLDRGHGTETLYSLGIKFRHESFGERSLVESVFSSFKQQADFLLFHNSQFQEKREEIWSKVDKSFGMLNILQNVHLLLQHCKAKK